MNKLERCHMCGEETADFNLLSLWPRYATRRINKVCHACSYKINDQLDAHRELAMTFVERMLKIWMRKKSKRIM